MNNGKRSIDAADVTARLDISSREDAALSDSVFFTFPDSPGLLPPKRISTQDALPNVLRSEGTRRKSLKVHSEASTGPFHPYIPYEFAQLDVPDLSMRITRDGEFPVAAGGCADIYKGTLVGIHRTSIKVAIKVIKVYSAEDNHPRKTKRLQRELKVWMKLNHPNVVSLFGTTSGFGPFPAMVCPWLENGTLTSYLEHRGADLKSIQLLTLILDIASGLRYLHRQSIVHGDLSGSNVLIEANERAHIADFGLSTILDEIEGSISATSSTGKPRGTLRWAAPELLDLVDHGDAKTQHNGPTTQSDIYSFGSLMLQILSSKIPYHYYSRDMQIIAAIFKGETPLRPDNQHVTDRRWGFIQRCWSPCRIRNVIQRPSSEEIVSFSTGEYCREFSVSSPPSDDNTQSHHSAKSGDPSAQDGPPGIWQQLHPHPPNQPSIHISSSPEAPCLHPEPTYQFRPILAPTQPPAVSPASPHEKPPQPPPNMPTSDEGTGILSMENIFSNGFWDSVLVPGYSDTMEGLSGGLVFGAGGSGLITPGWLPSPLPS